MPTTPRPLAAAVNRLRAPSRRSPQPSPAWLQGSTVLVTGASSGIGRELARLAAVDAATVVLVARREERLRELADEITSNPGSGRAAPRVEICVADLAAPDGVPRLMEQVEARVGEIEVLVNNAGFGDYSPFELADPQVLTRMIAVNVTAPTLLARAALPGMVERGRGGIMMVSSGAGQQSMPGAIAYSATKHYVNGLTEGLRGEAAGTGVVVSQLAPGPVATEFDEVSGMGVLTGAIEQIRISPQQCAAEGWAGFLAGQAMIYPGAAYRAAMIAASPVPQAFSRPALARLGKRMRRSQG